MRAAVIGKSSGFNALRLTGFGLGFYRKRTCGSEYGRGIALLPQRPAYDDLVSGALQVLLPELQVPDRPLYAIYGPGQETPRKITVFLDFLTRWFSENPIPAISR